jgi:antitoxin component of MazEF toxin-antitoxin module
MDFDYKKYSLEKLETWVRDALTSAEATPQEVYDTIKGVVDEEYHYFKHHAGRCYDLLCLLNGNGKGHIEAYDAVMREKEYYEPSMPPWGHSDLEYLVANKKDKVKKWVLPVEVSDDLEDYIVSFPDDLLEAANLKEGDQVEWVDQGDGSYLLKKVVKRTEKVSPDNMTWDQAMEGGWSMTDDGFWIKG